MRSPRFEQDEYHGCISSNQNLDLRVIQDDRTVVTTSHFTDWRVLAREPRAFPESPTRIILPTTIRNELLELYAFIFCQGGFRQRGMTFERFLLVAAAIKPADLPAILEDCSLIAEGRYLRAPTLRLHIFLSSRRIIEPAVCYCTSLLCPRHMALAIWVRPPSRGLTAFAKRARRGGKHSPWGPPDMPTHHINLYLRSPATCF